ncbi:hypothetical protein PENTCL1PPCAC_23202, partial [Pristionchus entomophagus]
LDLSRFQLHFGFQIMFAILALQLVSIELRFYCIQFESPFLLLFLEFSLVLIDFSLSLFDFLCE